MANCSCEQCGLDLFQGEYVIVAGSSYFCGIDCVLEHFGAKEDIIRTGG